MKRSCLIVGLLICFDCAGLSGEQRKTVDPIDIVSLKSLSDAQISPDGSYIAYVLHIPNPANEHSNAQIWLVATDGRSQARLLVSSNGSETVPRWSPDGKCLAFLSDRESPPAEGLFRFSIRGDEGRSHVIPRERQPRSADGSKVKRDDQIWMISLQGGGATPVTDIPGGVKTFEWSKDGKLLAFIRTDQETEERVERTRRKDDETVVGNNYLFDRLWVYEFATLQARLLSKQDINIDTFDWSPDGSRFLARVSPTPRMNDYWRASKIVILSASTGATEKTLLENAAAGALRWSPDGHSAVFAKTSPRSITSVPIIYDMDTAKETVIGGPYLATIGPMEWDPDGKSLTASAIEGTAPIFLKIDANSGSATKLTSGKGPGGIDEVGPFTASKDRQKLAYLQETPEHPLEVCLRSSDQERVLTNTNPQVADWAVGSTEELSWSNSKDGMRIHGVLLLPPNYDKGQRHKTIVYVHGGPEQAWISGFHGTWYDWGVILASHGYVVLLPNPRGSDGAGPAFTEANYRDWGGEDFQDIIDGIDMLIANGITDADRLGIGGWSFGGFMTAWMVTHTNRFKAAIVGAGITDLFSMATTTDISPNYLNSYFGDLASNRKVYDEHSPVRFLDDGHTPTLIVHGEADVRVPISQGEEFYYGLRVLGREAQMIRYPREPHVFTEVEHQKDSLERMLRWYDAHISP